MDTKFYLCLMLILLGSTTVLGSTVNYRPEKRTSGECHFIGFFRNLLHQLIFSWDIIRKDNFCMGYYLCMGFFKSNFPLNDFFGTSPSFVTPSPPPYSYNKSWRLCLFWVNNCINENLKFRGQIFGGGAYDINQRYLQSAMKKLNSFCS